MIKPADAEFISTRTWCARRSGRFLVITGGKADHGYCMEPADSIRRLGFARWYERRLIEGHAWFISGFMCMIAIAASVEELGARGSGARLVAYALLVAGFAAIGVFGLVRYQKILTEAEELGEHATCRACGTYARFNLITSTQVRCRNCSNEWRLIQPEIPE
jgi:hypothetical protein